MTVEECRMIQGTKDMLIRHGCGFNHGDVVFT